MSNILREITQPKELTAALENIKKSDAQPAVLCHLGGGALRFAFAIFPSASAENIYAKCQERDSEGKGAHFDVHQAFIDPVYPWLGVFNFAGTSDVQAMELPDDLAQAYATRYQKIDEAAYEARRHFSSIAMQADDANIFHGILRERGGLVLPQLQHQHIVHEVTPQNERQPGSFVKLVVAGRSEAAREQLESDGYQSLDTLTTDALTRQEPYIDMMDGDDDDFFDIFATEPTRRPGIGDGLID